jgi:DNA (cytosine-5)-methyltransferase 1
MNYLDLFAGIGGFAKSIKNSGGKFDNHFFSEIDPYAVKVYQKRFPDAIGLGDITKIKAEDLPNGDWIITGGFPCQDISIAGKGSGLSGKRSGLWYEYWRLIRDLRPRYAIMENVGALTFRGLDAVLGSLAEIGYNAEWQDIRASDVGAPHRRERIWIVAYPECNGLTSTEKRGIDLQTAVKYYPTPSASDGKGSGKNETERNRLDYAIEKPEGLRLQGQLNPDWVEWLMGYPKGWTDSECDEQNDFFGWLTDPADEGKVSRLTERKDNRANRLKCLGNSIVPQIPEIIFQMIFNISEEA